MRCWVLTAAIPLLFSVASSAETEWNLVRAESDPFPHRLYKRSTASGFAEWKAEGVLPFPARVAAQAALHNLLHPPNATFQRSVLSHESNTIVLYQYMPLPLVSDRDVVTKTKYGVDSDGTYLFHWRDIERPATSRIEGVIRLPEVEGSMEFVPIGDAQTRVVERSLVDLGGSIPAWLVNARMGESLLQDLEQTRATASAGRYGSVEFPPYQRPD